MTTQQKLIQIRTRKLGLLIYDARMASCKSVEQCAQAVNRPVDEYQAVEAGELALTLPELEALAYYLDTSLEHFWGRTSMSGKVGAEPVPNLGQLTNLRNRVIGTLLRMARTRLNLTFGDLVEKTGIDEPRLRQFEQGEAPIPLPELEVLAASLGMRIEEFFDERGPVGIWRDQKQKIERFLELPPELQAFVSAPVNRPYIELAIRLSELNVEKLRAVAEGLLEITY